MAESIVCRVCEIPKDKSEFEPNSRRCKQCRRDYHNARWPSIKESKRIYDHNRGKDPAFIRKRKDRLLRKEFGIGMDDYEQMLESQDSRCAICRTLEPTGYGKVFVVDHDHATGKVRGLLCHRCNLGIGYLNDDFDLVIKASAYLQGASAHLRKRNGS